MRVTALPHNETTGQAKGYTVPNGTLPESCIATAVRAAAKCREREELRDAYQQTDQSRTAVPETVTINMLLPPMSIVS